MAGRSQFHFANFFSQLHLRLAPRKIDQVLKPGHCRYLVARADHFHVASAPEPFWTAYQQLARLGKQTQPERRDGCPCAWSEVHQDETICLLAVQLPLDLPAELRVGEPLLDSAVPLVPARVQDHAVGGLQRLHERALPCLRLSIIDGASTEKRRAPHSLLGNAGAVGFR